MKLDELKLYQEVEDRSYILVVLLGTESTNHNIDKIVKHIRNRGEKRPIYINASMSVVGKQAGNPWIYIPEMNRIHTGVLIDCILSRWGEDEVKSLYTSEHVERAIEFEASDVVDKFKSLVSEERFEEIARLFKVSYNL